LWARVLGLTTLGLIAVVAVLSSWKKTNHAPEARHNHFGRILRKPLYPGFPWVRPPPGWVDEHGRTLERIWDDEEAEYRHYITTPTPPPPSYSSEDEE
jgi:hypothetical protein